MVHCVGVIPAGEMVDPAAGLNVLVMAVNEAAQEASSAIRLFGTAGCTTRFLTEKECTFAPREHAHLYFHIEAACFSAAFWGEPIEELILFAGTDAPQTTGKLVFIDM